MLVTIISNDGIKELYYWEQRLSWYRWLLYRVSQKSMDLISNCDYKDVQITIKTIMDTEEFVWEI